MESSGSGESKYALDDGSQIAVIGGGPTGSFFSIFALDMARMMGKDLKLTIFEPKDFTKDGPGGCNRCGGIISELLVQMLAVEGINLPETVVRKGIHSYKLHTAHGHVHITTPELEKTIATVYRGGGPKGMVGDGSRSFDHFLLQRAMQSGAVHEPSRIDDIKFENGRPVLFSQKKKVMEADLVVGAFGINSTAPKIMEGLEFGYKQPPLVTAAIAELRMEEDLIRERFGNSIHLFLLPAKGIKFAAMIPKGAYITLCILGKEMSADTVSGFLANPVVKAVLPPEGDYNIECRCLPKMNVGAPKVPFSDRVVMCGDAGSTRLFKDGLGAAYLMGKAAAKTAVLHGAGREDFIKEYAPVYQSIITDNYFGRLLYLVTDLFRVNSIFTKGMLKVVENEQAGPEAYRVLSSVLWDMFTGNERYKNIFPRAINPRMNFNLVTECLKSLVGK